MTRIAYVVSQYPAPSHTFIRREIAALRKRGVAIYPFSIRPGSPPEEDVPAILAQSSHRLLWLTLVAALGNPLRTISTWLLAQRHRPAGLRSWVWAQLHFVEALVLAAMMRQAGVSRVHSHFANSGATVAMLAANRLGLPWSLTLHGISETDPPAGGLLGEKLERADFVACASWFMRAQGMRLVAPEIWPKFHIVRCGVELRPSARRRASSTNRPFRFVTVGRISAEKGYPGLLQAFAALIARGVDAHLAIVGDGQLRNWLEAEVEANHIADRITILGALAEMDTLASIATADVFVLSSLMEGLPVVLVEAMALEKPVIAPHVAGIPELLEDGRTGLLYRPGDWDELGQCMQRIAVDHELRKDIAGATRDRVEIEFNIDRAVEPLARLFGAKER